jgi:hypothetical protein
VEEDESAAAKLRKLFTDFQVKGVWVVKTRDGKTYYTAKDYGPEREKATPNDLVQVRYFFSDKEKDTLVPLTARDIVATGKAPQSVLADKVHMLTSDFKDCKAWDDTMVTIALEVCKADNKIDPILRVKLLNKVVHCACQGSYPLSNALGACRQHLDKEVLDPASALWMEPDNDKLQAVRRHAEKILDGLPPLGPAMKAAAEQQRALERVVRLSSYELAGWLAQDKKGAWHCRGGSRPAGDYELGVVVAGPDRPADKAASGKEDALPETPALWKTIGTLKAGKAQIDAARAEALVEGRLVFARKNQSK